MNNSKYQELEHYYSKMKHFCMDIIDEMELYGTPEDFMEKDLLRKAVAMASYYNFLLEKLNEKVH